MQRPFSPLLSGCRTMRVLGPGAASSVSRHKHCSEGWAGKAWGHSWPGTSWPSPSSLPWSCPLSSPTGPTLSRAWLDGHLNPSPRPLTPGPQPALIRGWSPSTISVLDWRSGPVLVRRGYRELTKVWGGHPQLETSWTGPSPFLSSELPCPHVDPEGRARKKRGQCLPVLSQFCFLLTRASSSPKPWGRSFLAPLVALAVQEPGPLPHPSCQATWPLGSGA